jgi:hypothetical protein
MDTITKFITPGIIFLLTLVFGIWLSNSGKPYNGILFNIHKLIALGAVIAATMQIYKIFKGVEVQSLVIALVIFTALCVVALFATGAMMIVGKLDYNVMLTIHRVVPFLTAVTMALITYLLTGKPHEI